MAILTILLSGFASLFCLLAGQGKEEPKVEDNRILRINAYLDRKSLLLEANDNEFPCLAWALCDVCTFIRQDTKARQLPENRAFIGRWFQDNAIEHQVFSEEPWQYFTPEIIAAIKADLARTSFPD